MTLRAEKLKKWQKFSKSLKKIVKISIKLRVFSDRLFKRSNGGGGGGGVLMGRGVVRPTVGGTTSQWGRRGNSGGGGQQLGCLRPLRTALHTISIGLQNSLS